MKKPFFSVIIPTHNGAAHIKTMLESIRRQTFTDYELIVVCDSCTDDTAEIATAYADKTIVSDCGRDGLARNAGLDTAEGEWVLFADDDDWFMHEYCFEILAKKLTDTDADILDYGFIWKGEGFKVPSRDECFVMAWCRAWRRSFIGDARFDDALYGSDKLFFQKMIQNNRDLKAEYFDSPVYYYNYLREGSMSWMEKQKTLLDIIVTHNDEPWETGRPFFDMLDHQQCAKMDDVCVTLVQDGEEGALPWKDLLAGYSYPVRIITIQHAGTAAARNAGLNKAQSDWVMFCDFDDMFADACSLSTILKNLPTDEYDVIWCKLIEENMWFTGGTYLNCVNGVNFANTDGKLYRRQFLNDHKIRFHTDDKYYYDGIFNAVVLAEAEPWKLPMMLSDFYPYLKKYRKNSLKHSLHAFNEIRKGVFNRDTAIAAEMKHRGKDIEYRRTVTKVIVYGYYDICTPDDKNAPLAFPDEFVDYFRTHRDIFYAVKQSSDFDVIREEVEVEVMNLIQNYYNEHKTEYYLRNDTISFNKWLIILEDFAEEAQPVPEPEETPAPVLEVVSITEEEPVILPANDREERVVVYCGTFDVYLNMVASCKSLLSNVAVDKVYFLIEDDEFPYDLPEIVECINVKNQTYFPPDGPNFDNSWTWMCMIRAAFPELFPQHRKILSLDIDIVINDNVEDLWDYDLTDYYLAGVAERQRQKSTADPLYVNFGVVMMNLEKMRQDGIQDKVIHMLNTQKVDCPEQGAFNKICAWHILELPAEFNFTTYSHITGEAQKERIIHYAGQKFWRHYALVKKYADLSWEEVMERQAKCHE